MSLTIDEDYRSSRFNLVCGLTAVGLLLTLIIFSDRNAPSKAALASVPEQPAPCVPAVPSAVTEDVGLFCISEAGVLYTRARVPAIVREDAHVLRVTHYGRPMFPVTNHVARWPMRVSDALEWSEELGLDGICAVWTTTPWYSRIRDEHPPILYIDGLGLFLAVDRVGHGTDVDVYVEDSTSCHFAGDREVWEVSWPNDYMDSGIN